MTKISRRVFLKGAVCGGISLMAITLDPFLLSGNIAFAERSTQPLWKPDTSRNKIVVVSDLHFGVDDSFAETVYNRKYFVEFLHRLQGTTDVRELVIAGDFLDEWFLPLNYAPVSNMNEFFIRIASNNQLVMDELKNVMKSGIKLVYVIGNHDMNLGRDTLEHLLPGIVQFRDAKGLGRYITGDRREIVIEHCHRYDPYSAPDRVSNRELARSDETMYPPGYFYARMGTSWVMEGRPKITKNYPVLVKPDVADSDQMGAYLYGKTLEKLFNRITEESGFEEKIFHMDSCGLHGAYSLQDMYPVNQPDGSISAPVLFRNFQRSWDKRQDMNDVWTKIPFLEAGAEAQSKAYFYKCAKEQYLGKKRHPYDVVVFGHTHVPDFQQDGKKFYINSGTWVDYNSDYPPATRTFAVVKTGAVNTAVLYQYTDDGSLYDMREQVNNS
jgi:UDP-2,3-diacylglucosamine pyrophosphatase LpxH